MTIKNPRGIGRAPVRVKSVQLPGKTEIEYVDREVIKEVTVSNITAEKRAHEAESKLAEALEVIDRMKADAVAPESDEPPVEIADIYEAYGMDPERLFKLHTDLTSRIAGNLPVSDRDRLLQSRLTPHVPWIRKRAKSVEVVG